MAGTGPALARTERITSGEATTALKVALDKGSRAAVGALGRRDGFFGDPRVRIPLPPSLERAESIMRRFGLGGHADELILAMNRAAEEAVASALELFVEAVRRMTVQDAKAILEGGDSAGTVYFRRSTEEGLRQRFLPIVRKATSRVGLARHYSAYAEKAVPFGLVKKEHANLDDYVTQKALDGLFLVLADEERRIREDPVSAGSAIVRRVFGGLGR